MLRVPQWKLAVDCVAVAAPDPRGMCAGSLALLTAVPVLFGAYGQVSGTSAVLTLPEAVWAFSLGVYLIARGFRPGARVFARSRAS